ncbi:MAG: glycoside hydrolase family 3 protein [Bacteroidales bacterium]
MKKISIPLLLLMLPFMALSQNTSWVDKQMSEMSLEQKIAQLLWVRVSDAPRQQREVGRLIRKYEIGGIIFFKNKVEDVPRLINRYQAGSKTPLMTAIDGEWGLGMRLDGAPSYPYAIGLGAVQDNTLLYEMGKQVGQQLKHIGLHMNLAPVADVNSNPNNPVIGYRSYGELPDNVACKTIEYMRGMQDAGVIATAKHFPGHGDTETDSHLSLPSILASKEKMNNRDLVPFKALINAGIGAVMTAHIAVPELTKGKELPATLSKEIIGGILKDELDFKGLVISDAMEMKGLVKFSNKETVEVDALIAGNDVLELVTSVPHAITNIARGVKQGKILENDIDEKCRKVLLHKKKAGLDNFKPLNTKKVVENINLDTYQSLNKHLIEQSLSMLKNDEALPLKPYDKRLAILTVSPNKLDNTTFESTCDKYCQSHKYYLNDDVNNEHVEAILKKLTTDYDDVIINTQLFWKTNKRKIIAVNNYEEDKSITYPYGMSPRTRTALSKLISIKRVVLVHLGIPYMLDRIEGFDKAKAILVLCQDGDVYQETAAKAVFGALSPQGKLSVSINEEFPAGTGLTED